MRPAVVGQWHHRHHPRPAAVRPALPRAQAVPDAATTTGVPAPSTAPPPTQPTCLKSLTLPALTAWAASLGEPHPAPRAAQLWRLMYYRDTRTGSGLITSWADAGPGVQGGFSASFLARATESGARLDAGLALRSVFQAGDGTRKLVFDVTAGPAAGHAVDAVLIPVVRRAGARPRLTLCISSQAGCRQGCTFCLTGAMGLAGSLTPGQIVEQAVAARRLLAALAAEAATTGADPPPPLTNIVFMGQGEPLDNYEAVSTAVSILTHPLGLAFGAGKVTLSTAGLLPALRAFAADHPRIQLALSLHATTDAGRAAIMPVTGRAGHGMADVAACLRDLFPDDGAGGRKRHVLIEYLLLDGVNDSVADAERLLALLAGVAAKVNLLNFNPHEAAIFGRAGSEAADAFRAVLVRGGRVCTVRASRGGDGTMAACGQLGDPGAAVRVKGVREARLARASG